jgi:molybdate transport system ATP-binding protein
MTMLELDLTARRGEFNLQVACRLDGRVTGLFGPSGSGKSTLLHMIAGLIRPAAGRISLGGQVLLDRDARIDLPPHRRGVAVVFQDTRLFPHFTVRGNLRYGLARRGDRTAGPDLETVIDLLELGTLLSRRPRWLSGGERQRVALGRALLQGPRLLLLDEPLVALDQRLKQQIIPFLQRVRDTVAVPIIYVSHDLTEMLQITDRLLLLHRGHVNGLGAYHELVGQDRGLEVLHPEGLTNLLTLESDDAAEREGLLVIGGTSTPGPALPPARLRLVGPVPAPGRRLQVAIRPQDVALAATRLAGVSIRNQVPARIQRISTSHGRVLVTVDIGQPLIVEITPAARGELGLGEAGEVWCLVKSSAIRRLQPPPDGA